MWTVDWSSRFVTTVILFFYVSYWFSSLLKLYEVKSKVMVLILSA